MEDSTITVTSLPVRDEFTASAGQIVFNYTFLIFTADDLNVYITPAGQDANDSTDLTTAYVVDTGTIGNPVGGFITLNSGTSAGDLVTIVSNIVDNRTTDYQNSGDFLPDTVNEDFDRVVSLVKQQEDQTGRTLAFPQSLQNATALTLPLPKAGQYVVWNAGETGLENAGAPGQIIPSELSGTALQMIASSTIVAGDFIITSGYNANGDGGDNTYFARATTGGPYNGGSLIASVGDPSIEFLGLFPKGIINIVQFGAVEGLDNSLETQAAIDFINSTSDGGELESGGINPSFNSTITIKNGVVFNVLHTVIRPLSDINIIAVNPGGQLKGARILTTGIVFSGDCVTLVPTSNTQGSRFIPWLDNVNIELAQGAGFGTGIAYDGTSFFLQLTTANDVVIRHGDTAVRGRGTNNSTQYVNGNVINGLVVRAAINSFDLDEFTNGNTFNGMMIEAQASPQNSKILIAGGRNRFSGIAFDQVPIIVSGDGNDLSALVQNTVFGADITDTGRDNRAGSSGSRQYDHTSINSRNDQRHDIFGNGLIEFRDMIRGQRDPLWTLTQQGAGAAPFATANFGAATGNIQFFPYLDMNTTGGVVTDFVQLDFGGNGFVRVPNRPTVHFTNHTLNSDGRIIWQIGLFDDVNNYIILTQDFNQFGDDDIRLECRRGGTSSFASMATSAFDRITFATIEVVSTTEVNAFVGQYVNTSTSDSGKVGRGINEMRISGLSATVTNNIPGSVDLQPFVRVEQGTGNAASMALIDYQLIAGYKSVT